MSGILNLILAGGAAQTPKAPFNYVTTLQTGNGSNGGTNSTFNDSSIVGATITRNGTPTQGLFSPFSQPAGYWSNYFSIDGSKIQVPASSAFAPGTGDFCVEMFVFVTAASDGQMIYTQAGSGDNYFLVFADAGATKRYGFAGPHPTNQFSASNALSLSTWQHLAVVRISGVITIYVDGVASGTPTANATAFSDTSYLPTIGGYTHTGSSSYGGNVSNFRYVKGNGVYTGSFTVPTGPLAITQSSGTNINAITGTQTSLLTCQNYLFKDNTAANIAVSLVGTPKILQFAPFTSGVAWSSGNGASLYFDGSGDYLTNIANTPQYIRGTGDWTFECFVYPFEYPGTGVGPDLFAVTNVTNGVGGGNANGFHINMGQDINSFRLISNASGGWADNISAGTGNGPPLFAWTHMAMVRQGDRISIFKNGNRVNTGTGFGGYIFSPTPGNSAGNYSLAVQGGNALNATSASDVFGTGNFTAEFFVYRSEGQDFASGFMLSGGNNGQSFEVRIGDGNRLIFHTGGSNVIEAGGVTRGQFTHCCVVRSGSNMSAWINGTRVYNNTSYTKDFSGNGNYYVIGGRGGGDGRIYNANMRLSTNVYYDPNSTSISPPYGGFGYNGGDRIIAGVSNNVFQNTGQPDLTTREGSPFTLAFGPYTQSQFNQAANSVVGRFSDGGTARDLNGFIAFPRFQQNAVYSASATTITVPTSAIGNDGDTLQLLPGTNAQAADSALKSDWVTVGGAQISSAQSKFGGSSIFFNGTDSFLRAASSQERIFRTGNFTIEGWIYPTSWNSNGTIVQANGVSNGPQFGRYGANNSLGFALSGGSWIITDATLPALNIWTHVAVSRSGTTIKIFVNGVQSGSIGTSAADFTAAAMTIGGNGAAEYFAGYMDDVRITTGYAVYTSGFKVPEALPTV